PWRPEFGPAPDLPLSGSAHKTPDLWHRRHRLPRLPHPAGASGHIFLRGLSCRSLSLFRVYVSWCDRRVVGRIKPGSDERRSAQCPGNPERIRITDIHQVEPVRRGGHTGKFAITEFQNITNPVFRLLTITNRHQGTGNIAYHMMKKGVGLHIYYDKRSASGYRNPLQKPNGSPGLATGSAKRREVVLADQCLGCAMHPFGIQRA